MTSEAERLSAAADNVEAEELPASTDVEQPSSDVELKAAASCCGQRYLIAVLICSGVAVLYAMRVSMSVAIVAMVNASASLQPQRNTSSAFVCELEIAPGLIVNSSTPRPTPSPGRSGELVLSRQTQGFVLSAFYVGYLVLQLPGASIAQRFGGKWVLAASILVSSLLTLVSPVAARTHAYLFIAVRALEGVAQGVLFPTANAMLGRWAPEGEVAFLSILATDFGTNIGSIVGQVGTGPLCDSAWGWPSAFYVLGAAGLLWLVPWALLAANSPETAARISPAERALIAASRGQHAQEALNRNHGVPWRHILADRAVWAIMLASFSSLWIFFAMLTCMPQFLSDVLRLSIMNNGFVSALSSITSIPVDFAIAAAADFAVRRCPRAKTRIRRGLAIAGFTVSGGALLGATFTECNAIAVIALLTTSVTGLSLMAGSVTMNHLDLSPEYCGSIVGLVNLVSTLAGIGTPLLSDELTAHGTPQEWNYVFYSGVAAAGLGAVSFGLMGSGEKRWWSYPPEQQEDDEQRLVQ